MARLFCDIIAKLLLQTQLSADQRQVDGRGAFCGVQIKTIYIYPAYTIMLFTASVYKTQGENNTHLYK